MTVAALNEWRARALQLEAEVGRAIVGQPHTLRLINVALFARGHDLEQQQNLPLEFLEAVPRRDFSRAFVLLAALACAAALVYRSLALRGWR